MPQRDIYLKKDYSELDSFLVSIGVKRIFLVCGEAIKYTRADEYFDNIGRRLGIEVVRFSEFTVNPKYEDIKSGVQAFRNEQCDVIVAVGGGSSIDVAKCIKLFSNMSDDDIYLNQNITENSIRIIAMPTTAGSGSEATHFAVLYYNDKKYSIEHESCLPDTVLWDYTVLETLPIYQKKSTMLDALCHSIEAFWSINSNEISKEYSKQAIEKIIEFKDEYLQNSAEGNKNMQEAANLAGKAIRIAKTTAGHALSYHITTVFDIAHGHSVAICLMEVWGFMISNIDRCCDVRGKEYLQGVLEQLGHILGCNDAKEGLEFFETFYYKLGLDKPKMNRQHCIMEFCESVNLQRLKNNPVLMTNDDIYNIYHKILY